MLEDQKIKKKIFFSNIKFEIQIFCLQFFFNGKDLEIYRSYKMKNMFTDFQRIFQNI